MAIYLHIGFPKTATTSLQLAFQQQQQDLLAADICYPLIEDDFKQRYLKHADMKALHESPTVREEYETSFEKMTAKIRESGCKDVILSCEELTNFMMMEFNRDNLVALRDRLREIDKDIRLAVYVRNPSDFYLSILQERLKRHGGVLSAGRFKTNFAGIIALYEDVFETEAVVREFHPTKLKDGDIVADFLHAVGLDRLDISNWEPVSSNESVSPEALAALDLARRNTTDSSHDVTYAFRESELFWRRLRKLSKDGGFARKPILFKSVHDQVMATNIDDSQVLNDKYGIDFGPGKFVEGAPALAPENWITDLEGVMDVQRDQVFHLWSVLSVDLIREVFRLRYRNQNLRAQVSDPE